MKKIIILFLFFLSCAVVRKDKQVLFLDFPEKETVYDSLMAFSMKVPKDAKYIVIQVFTETKKYGNDPFYIISLIKNESNFDSSTISPKGAKGLMQLRPRFFGNLTTRKHLEIGIKHLNTCFQWAKNDTAKALSFWNFGRKNTLNTPKNRWPEETKKFIVNVSKCYKGYKND